MKRQWTNEELIADFTISAKELDLIGDSKTDHNLLGAACLLKYFQHEGRFPAQKQDIPQGDQKSLWENHPAVSLSRSGGRQARWHDSRGGLSGGERADLA